MLVWINGTFGVGKTTTAGTLHERAGWPVFDPEHVGYLVGGHLRDHEFDDFQDLAPWRRLVPVVANELFEFRGQPTLVAVQSVLRESYWRELQAGLEAQGLPCFHVVLDADAAVLRSRIEADEEEAQAREWRLDHLAIYEQARPWMHAAADLVVDTTTLDPHAVAEVIVAARD